MSQTPSPQKIYQAHLNKAKRLQRNERAALEATKRRRRSPRLNAVVSIEHERRLPRRSERVQARSGGSQVIEKLGHVSEILTLIIC